MRTAVDPYLETVLQDNFIPDQSLSPTDEFSDGRLIILGPWVSDRIDSLSTLVPDLSTLQGTNAGFRVYFQNTSWNESSHIGIDEEITLIKPRNWVYYTSLIKNQNIGLSDYQDLSKFYTIHWLSDQIPARLEISSQAKQHFVKRSDGFQQIISVANFLLALDCGGHKIDLLNDPEGKNVIVQYLIPTNSREDRLKRQQELVSEVITEFPEEEFIDFMIKVYFEG